MSSSIKFFVRHKRLRMLNERNEPASVTYSTIALVSLMMCNDGTFITANTSGNFRLTARLRRRSGRERKISIYLLSSGFYSCQKGLLISEIISARFDSATGSRRTVAPPNTKGRMAVAQVHCRTINQNINCRLVSSLRRNSDQK